VDQLGCLALVDNGSHDQDLAAKALSLRGTQELRSCTFAQIKIQQHDINLPFLQNPKGFFDCAAMRYYFESRFGV